MINNKSQPIYSLLYTRISSKSQKKEGSGDASQGVRCLEYSNFKGYIYEKTFEDVFTGGGNYMNRKGMVELLAHIDAHKNKRFVVIFDDLKRFARDVKFHITLREELAKRKARVESPNFHFDDSPEGEANELHTAVSNQLERKQNQRQVIQKQTARLVDGYWPFHALKGYTMIKIEGYGKIMFPNPQGEAVKQALEGFASKKFLYKIDVAHFLKQQGVLGKQPAEKYIDTITSILQNIMYAGYIEYPKRGISRRKAKHESLISLETYELIQKRLKKSDGAKIRQDIRNDFPIRGLVDCATCQNKLTGGLSRGRRKKYAYYNCCSPECPFRGKTIKRKDLEDEFSELLKDKDVLEEVVKYTKVIYEDAWATAIETKQETDEKYKYQIQALEQEIDSLISLAAKSQSQIVRNQYEKRVEHLGEQIEELQAEIDNKSINYQIPFRTAMDTVFGLLKTPYFVWQKWDTSEKHLLFPFIFEVNPTYVKGEGFRTVKLSLGIRVLEENSNPKNGHVDIPRNTLNQFVEFIYKWYFILKDRK